MTLRVEAAALHGAVIAVVHPAAQTLRVQALILAVIDRRIHVQTYFADGFDHWLLGFHNRTNPEG